jgi:hypothetical protein
MKCSSLTEVSFERGSKLSRIVRESFCDCPSLRSFCIPAQLEVVAWDVVTDCKSLTELTFEIPSRLKRLGLPPSEFGSLCIPDSVEFICGFPRESGDRSRVLQFGEKSHLKEVKLHRARRLYGQGNDPEEGIGIFIRLSERHLRYFRSKYESS